MKTRSLSQALRCSSLALLIAACGGTDGGESIGWVSSELTGTDFTPTSASNVWIQYVAPQPGEGHDKVYDNNAQTKAFFFQNKVWIRYQMTRPITIVSYDVTSANDFPERDPRDWTFEGSFDGLRWTVLDTRTNQTFAARFQRNSYTFSNSTPYLYYRLNITANVSGNEMQFAEFRVGGTQPAGTVPATVGSVTASANGTSINLSWPAASGATNYFVQRYADDGTTLFESQTSSTSFTDSNLGRGIPYVYRIQASNGSLRAFQSASSNRVVTAGGTAGLKDLTALDGTVPTDQWGTTGSFEGVSSITDNATGTKYLTFHPTTWVIQRTASSSVVTQYTLTSGNDYAGRDPKNWTLEGSSSASGPWTVIDTRTNQGFANRHQTRVFTANPSNLSFTFYRLNITQNHNDPDNISQLAEWRLFGPTGGNVAAPSAPTGLTATALTSNQIELFWTDAAGKLNPETSYTVERATNSTFTSNLVSRTTGGGSDEFRSTALAASTTYFFRVRASNPAGSSAWATVSAATPAATAPPTSFVETGWYPGPDGIGHSRTVFRRALDSNIALYADEFVPNTTNVDWLRPIFSEFFSYVKTTYGSFSDPLLVMILEQGGVPGGELYGGLAGVLGHDSPGSFYRNLIFSGGGDWSLSTDRWNINSLTHELGHIVEGTNNGWQESPSFSAWGDSKWADVFLWDVQSHSTVLSAAYINDTLQELLTGSDGFGNFWFRDLWYPLYQGSLGNTDPSRKGGAVLSRYYQLLAQYLPKLDSRYAAKGLTLGEFIHFLSGAAGVNLEPQAKITFRWSPENELQFANAQLMFPDVFALYSGGTCTPETNAAFCSRLGASCGSLTAPDNCGTSRTVSSCGSCTSPQTCGGGGTPNVCGSSGGSDPCASLCTGPTDFQGPGYQSNNLGTNATCHRTLANLSGLVCGNFAANRTFRINNTLINCSVPVLPPKRNGGYCFQASAGDFAWAYFSTW